MFPSEPGARTPTPKDARERYFGYAEASPCARVVNQGLCVHRAEPRKLERAAHPLGDVRASDVAEAEPPEERRGGLGEQVYAGGAPLARESEDRVGQPPAEPGSPVLGRDREGAQQGVRSVQFEGNRAHDPTVLPGHEGGVEMIP